MFAVIKTGGKQYRVAAGDEFAVEKLTGATGDTIEFDEVLMLGGDAPTVGTPLVDGAMVTAEVLDQFRAPKVLSFKKRRRKHGSKRLRGHRQHLTMVRVTDILTGGAKPKAKAKASKPVEEKPVPKKAAPKKAEAAAPEKDTAKEAAAAAKPGNLLDAPKGEADDLRKISGVGPKLVEKLNANGVFHFWQIAEWGPSDIAYMDDQLSFKGRIERDNWIEQAKDFAAESKSDE
ncbi:MAG: 50S ribosomal protein L21 [Paracoccaceae bacterium]|nr:50S ribosomal protein L21 [Paracoccaceae bacterium]